MVGYGLKGCQPIVVYYVFLHFLLLNEMTLSE
jgi:hypothetical protein